MVIELGGDKFYVYGALKPDAEVAPKIQADVLNLLHINNFKFKFITFCMNECLKKTNPHTIPPSEQFWVWAGDGDTHPLPPSSQVSTGPGLPYPCSLFFYIYNICYVIIYFYYSYLILFIILFIVIIMFTKL